MHHDHLQAIRNVQDLGLRLAGEDLRAVEVSVHPPFTDLRSVQTVIEDRGVPVALGAQHCYSERAGAFTGEISPPMLAKLGVSYVIVGHSERRQLFGETDQQVAATLRAVLDEGMTPIVCVGETEDERDRGLEQQRLRDQVTAAFAGLQPEKVASCVLAYEPIWAIGTGKTATADDAQSACLYIRSVLGELSGKPVASGVRVQYGGSVRPDNAAELMAETDVDGLLVGSASLEAASFAAIVHNSVTAAAAVK